MIGNLAKRFIESVRERNIRWVNPAWICVASGLMLTVLGAYAIDIAAGQVENGSGLFVSGRSRNQIMTGLLAIGLAVCVAIPNPKRAKRLAVPLFLLMLVVLFFLLVPFVPRSIVRPRNGARSWIDFGPINVQPSEIAKIAYVLTLAWWLCATREHRKLTGLLFPAIITFLPAGLITLQPDLGTASLFAPTLVLMLVTAGAKLKHIFGVLLIALLLAPATYPFLKPHQKQRIQGIVMLFKGDSTGSDDINFQQLTAQRITGAGKVLGNDEASARSLVEYNRLPESETDMIYAVIVNRFGVFGGLFVLWLYSMWVLGAAWVAMLNREGFGRLIVVGFLAMIAFQVVINIGMTLGLVPIIGITLPFLSYGRSSLIATWLMTGLVLAVGLRRQKPTQRVSFEYADDDA
ncbi:MAG: FtsW/RodA/SpoVE family cell cycle protein [Phycisphaeraceae bacterium]|nr:FtsW/RodA/SpoVE family cell cycle protein [Phycisphaerales bacterium]MCB9860872.1 FtsW/RodA/SpoVE family cell cycle protein [Phycisphaeraceae bacterium]